MLYRRSPLLRDCGGANKLQNVIVGNENFRSLLLMGKSFEITKGSSQETGANR